jgi:basic membrane protein A and related proteins
MSQALSRMILASVLALLLIAAGCTSPTSPKSPDVPVVYIVYGSEKGDLSYTDAAYRGIQAAQHDMPVTVREFSPKDLETLAPLLNSTPGRERPGLVITVGFQYADLTRQLALQHPDIRFLAIDTAGIGSGTVQAYEITSYGDSYLSGVLAANATRTGHVGIILGMQSALLDTFLRGFTDGARAANRSIIVEHAYVRQNSTEGFTDPEQAGRIAESMYRNGTDVIFMASGYSNTGGFDAAKSGTGRYVIGTDSDQSHLGPKIVLASAIKRVDRVVYNGISRYVNGTFTGGNTIAGLKEGVTGMIYNPEFEYQNATVSAWETRAQAAEAVDLNSRDQPGRA